MAGFNRAQKPGGGASPRTVAKSAPSPIEPDRADTRIVRRSLHDELIGRLRTLIVEGELEAGHSIVEMALCERFGVSRTPLREALKALANEGLVELSPNRGALVAKLRERDIEEIFPIISSLEQLASGSICGRITEDEIADIVGMHEQMTGFYRRNSRPDFFKMNYDFHDAIIAAAGNLNLLALHRMLSMRVMRARYLANISRQRWAQGVDEHETIVAALIARDKATLTRALREHLNKTAALVLEFLHRDVGGVRAAG